MFRGYLWIRVASNVLTDTGRRGQHQPVWSHKQAQRSSVVCVAVSHVSLPSLYRLLQARLCCQCRHENPVRRWSRFTVQRRTYSPVQSTLYYREAEHQRARCPLSSRDHIDRRAQRILRHQLPLARTPYITTHCSCSIAHMLHLPSTTCFFFELFVYNFFL